MLYNWISAKNKLQLPATLIDFDDIQIGLEFALSPEILSLLSGQTPSAPQSGYCPEVGTISAALDEHELALA